MGLPGVYQLVIIAVPLLAAVTVHELAHGWVAWKLGDPTPKLAGRLTLNPLKHLDPVGTLALVVTQAVGWAKPVPVNPIHFKNPKRDLVWVSLAGPLANFALALVFALLYRVFSPFSHFMAHLFVFGVQINVGLGIFNLLPVPPLDGSKVLAGLLPSRVAYLWFRYEVLGIVLLFVLIFTGVVGKIILPVIVTISKLLLGG